MCTDTETRSFVNLKKSGAWVYSEHASTDLFCLAYGTDTVKLWQPGEPVPDEFKNFDGQHVAHYALFEYALFYNILVPRYGFPKKILNINNWICTRALSLCAGMPGHLKDIPGALNLKHKKQEIGGRLINRYSIPYTDKETGFKAFRPLEGEDKELMFKYCKQDVAVSFEIYKKLHKLPNVALERDAFLLDMQQNIAGVPVDTTTLKKMIKIIDKAMGVAEKEAEKLGVNVRSYDQIIERFKNHGVTLPNCQVQTITDILQKNLPPELKQIAELRLFLGKASVKKYYALQLQACKDKKIRYTIKYYGAHTGRYSGQGFQPHNLPKTKTNTKEIEMKIKELPTVKDRDTFIKDTKIILPGMVKAETGMTFLLGDFEQVEARGIALLADEKLMLKQFRQKRDLYKEMACRIFNIKDIENIDGKKRDVGKTTVLGCGYGMGWRRFHEDNKDRGIDKKLAQTSINTFRQTYGNIVNFWYALQDAYLTAMQYKKEVRVGEYLTVFGTAHYVGIKLPSGRILYYHKPKISKGQLSYYNHQRKMRVHIWGGLLAENVTQAMCRDILVDRMLECNRRGLNPVLHVHDEIINYIYRKEQKAAMKLFKEIMNTAPDWCKEFPLATEIEVSRRYHK